ncbi:MAG: shikimate kinase [Ruminococcaceae bacterium]|nr:shikimate kinase [Oscillospiraceae bacterium]
MKNIVLIGMPGAGKSTLGVLLAKALGYSFVDTDIVIQQREKRLLQDIIDNDGIETFLEKEEAAILSVVTEGTVIATGGSAVYSEKAMSALKENSTVVYIDVDYHELKHRLTDISTRGIVLKDKISFYDVYLERTPIYEKYSDITVYCSGKSVEKCVNEIIQKLKKE